MHNERFFDQTLGMIAAGASSAAVPMLAGKLYNAHADAMSWPETRAALHRHALFDLLMEDPFSAYARRRPRGYPGDAGLIDIIYDKAAPGEVPGIGRGIIDVTVGFQAPEGVRQRRRHAEKVLTSAWQAGQRVLVLACGHFREADRLIGQDLGAVTVVDQDPLSLAVVRANHGARIAVHEANVFLYLKGAAARGERFDLIYTLGLTDYLDARATQLLHRMSKSCLAPQGRMLLANFLPGHLGTGWMAAVMDWHLIYRDEHELERYAAEVGMTARCWRDPTGSVVWSEMDAPE